MDTMEIIGAILAILIVGGLFCLIHELVHAFTCNECPYKDYCERHKDDKDFISPCDEQNMMRDNGYGSNGFQI